MNSIEELVQAKSAACLELKQLLSLLSVMFDSELWEPTGDVEEGFNQILAINLPTGWIAWPVHDTELHLFSHLPQGENRWDGHTEGERAGRIMGFKAILVAERRAINSDVA